MTSVNEEEHNHIYCSKHIRFYKCTVFWEAAVLFESFPTVVSNWKSDHYQGRNDYFYAKSNHFYKNYYILSQKKFGFLSGFQSETTVEKLLDNFIALCNCESAQHAYWNKNSELRHDMMCLFFHFQVLPSKNLNEEIVLILYNDSVLYVRKR